MDGNSSSSSSSCSPSKSSGEDGEIAGGGGLGGGGGEGLPASVGLSFADLLPKPPQPREGLANATPSTPEFTIPTATTVFCGVIATQPVCNGLHNLAMSLLMLANALFLLVGPFTGLADDLAARRNRYKTVAGTLQVLESDVRKRCTVDDGAFITELFGRLAHGVGLPDEGDMRCTASDLVGQYTEAAEAAMWDAGKSFTTNTDSVARCGRNHDNLLLQVQYHRMRLDNCPGRDPSATAKAKREHRQRVNELTENLVNQQEQLDYAAKSAAGYQQAADDAAADRLRHFVTAWAWRVVVEGALPRRTVGEEGGGASKGEDGRPMKRKNPFAT